MSLSVFKSLSQEELNPKSVKGKSQRSLSVRPQKENDDSQHRFPFISCGKTREKDAPSPVESNYFTRGSVCRRSNSVFPGSLEESPSVDLTMFKAGSRRIGNRRGSEMGTDTELQSNIVRMNVGGTIFNTTKTSLQRELEFWEIPAIWVSACCWYNIHDALQDKKQHQDLGSSPESTRERFQLPGYWNEIRANIWTTLYDSRSNSWLVRTWNNLIAGMIVATLVVFFLNSGTEYPPHVYYEDFLSANRSSDVPLPSRRVFALWLIDVIFLGIMSLEFLLKMFASRSVKKYFANVFTTMYGVSLLACIVGHVAESIMSRPENWLAPDSVDGPYVFLNIVHFLRMVRFFELLDRNASLRVMWIATKRCQAELLTLLGVFIVIAIFFGVLVFYSENRGGRSEQFANADLATSVYWAIITMTTVGYGDITPQSRLGRVVGAVCSLFGVIVLAMPVAVLTDSFQQYHLRQKIRHEKLEKQKMFFQIQPESDSVNPNPNSTL